MYHVFSLPDSSTDAADSISGGGNGGGGAAAEGAAGRLLASIRADPAYVHRSVCVYVLGWSRMMLMLGQWCISSTGHYRLLPAQKPSSCG